MPNYEIISQEEYDAGWYGLEDQALIPFPSYARENYGLGVWTYQFEIEVFKGDESRNFTIAFQPEERTNGMKAYTGYELSPATEFGYDADESSVLLEYCDDNPVILKRLKEIAFKKAKEEFHRLTKMGSLAS